MDENGIKVRDWESCLLSFQRKLLILLIYWILHCDQIVKWIKQWLLLSCGHMEEIVFVYWFPSQTVQFWPGNEVVEEMINFISYASRYQLIIDQFTCMSLRRYFLLEIYCLCKSVLQCCIIKQILIGRP